MEKKPVGNYLEHRLNGKEDQEGVFNLLQAGVGNIAVILRHRQVDGQCNTVGKDGQEDDDLEGFPLHNTDTRLPQRVLQG